MCQKSIATHSTDYSKSLDLAIPLRKLNKLLQNDC